MSKNKIIIGTANFIKEYGLNRKKISVSERRNILNYLKLRKILHFDVSDSYGNLGFENNFSNIRNKKINLKFNLKKIVDIEKYFFKSLENLNVKKFDTLMFHNEKDLLLSKNQGKIKKIFKLNNKKTFYKKIGVSVYSVDYLKKIILSGIKINVVQIPINIFNQTFDEKLLSDIKKRNIEIHARSIFLQGLTLKNSKNINNNLLKKKLLFFEKHIKKLNTDKLTESVNFVKNNKYIDKFVIGFENLKQLKSLIEIFNKKKIMDIKYKKFAIKNKNIIDPRKWKKKFL